MNVSDYTYILNKPDAVSDRQTMVLERIVHEFPYFQSARALHLKGLYNQDSFRYNQQLKVTAAYTTDRSVLFDFITSGNFKALQQQFFDEKEAVINEIMVNEMEVVPYAAVPEIKIDTLEQSILDSIKEASTISENEEKLSEADAVEQKLEIGKPLEFSGTEKHSFGEWLQLAACKPIERENQPAKTGPEDEKKKKIEIIDRFIEANPKISPVKDHVPTPAVSTFENSDTSALMTETLAKVYLEQRKYSKAIQAYEILILKYPEKSSLFADRISDIRILQQNNN
ncbi:tetratricopeptide repeat protein [Flavobacterium sp.]|uniref:tetratricopeptide repeat protein n=1 Tax=Flavobacterium sp. TaxID=239 RepID=UPI00260927CF|nr:tetratricopeptide repeat protein [Flavobacterium sp.]